MAGSDIRSSVPLQITLYFHDYYVYLVFLVSVLAFVYKSACRVRRLSVSSPAATLAACPPGMHLVYPEGVFGAEVAFIVAYLLLEKARLRVSSRGNKTEQVLPTAAGLLAAFLSAILHVYYLALQTYV